MSAYVPGAHAVLAAGTGFPTPHIEYGKLSPMLIVFGAAIVGILIEAFTPRSARYAAHLAATLVGLVAAFGAVVGVAYSSKTIAAQGSVAVDGPALFLQGTILLLAILSVLLMAERGVGGGHEAFTPSAAALPGSEHERTALASGLATTEVFPLTMFSVGGMMLFASANDLLTMFIALEVLSLPLYLLCGLARRRRLLSQEAAMKYFLLGAFSSAFFLYGIAMLYGYAGTVRLTAGTDPSTGKPLPSLAEAISAGSSNDALLLIGIALAGVGLLFKVGAAPFHVWTPDAYQGAPTPVTGFMAAATKVAAFGAMARLFYVGLYGMSWDWRPVMWGVAILTMVVGSVIAITQTDVKRMLAYSAVLNAGFLLLGVVSTSSKGLSAMMFYLAIYGFAILGSFAVVTLVRDAGGEATHLSRWAGLGRRSPLLASVFAIFLLTFAGIPLTGGFTGKFALFRAAVDGGATPLAIVAVVVSAVAAFFYLRVVVLMFFSEPAPDGPTVSVPGAFTSTAIAVGVAVTVVLGILPQPVLDLAGKAAQFLSS